MCAFAVLAAVGDNENEKTRKIIDIGLKWHKMHWMGCGVGMAAVDQPDMVITSTDISDLNMYSKNKSKPAEYGKANNMYINHE